MAPRPASGYWALLRHHRDFRLLWLSDALAYFAIWSSTMVLLHVVHQGMDSNLAQGLLLTAQFLPAFFLMPVASHILDRYDHRHVIIVSKVCNGGLALVLLFGAPGLPVAAIFAVYVLYSTSITMFIIASGAFLPSVVTREDLTRANVLLRVTPSVMLVVSGAFLADRQTGLENRAEFLIVALTFFSSALLFAGIRDARRPVGDFEGVRARGPVRRFVEGLRYLLHHRELALAFALRMALYVGVGGQVLLSIFAEDVFERGESGTALLYTARGLGMLVGGFGLAQLVLSRTARSAGVVGLGLALFGLGYILASVVPALGIGMVAVMFGLGFVGEGAVKPFTMSLLQQHADRRFLGRVMAAEQGLSAVVQSSAALVISASVATAGPTGVLWASAATGALLILIAMASLVAARR